MMAKFEDIEFNKGTTDYIKHALYNAYISYDRVRITYKAGYEDFTGYHDRTGLIHFCYIGCSTGIKPILLEIPSKRSIGGGGLLTNVITDLKVLNYD